MVLMFVAMAEKKHQISLVDFVILQFLDVFRSGFDGVASLLKWNFWQKPQTPAIENQSPVAEKRHFIQLYKTEPKEKWEKPICYMNVIEFDTTHQEEEIRRRKWSHELQSKQDFLQHQNHHRRTRSDNDLQRFYRRNLRY